MDWTYDPDGTDSTYVTEYVYVLHDGDLPTRVEFDRHLLGLFARAEWLQLLKDIGSTVRVVQDAYRRDVFVARRSE
jgi:hypothetical protein